MLISACPVNAVARMVDTVYYISISRYTNGLIFKSDASGMVDTSNVDKDFVSSSIQTTFITNKFVTMSQIGSTSKVLLGGKVH